jgi:hypothetical protein
VVALDAAGNRSAPSPRVVVTTPPPGDTEPPTAPGTPVPGAAGPGGVTLTWTPSTDNVGVVDYLVINLASGGTAVLGVTTGTSITLGPLAPNQTYILVVVARDAAGNRSPQSGPLTITIAPGCTVFYRIVSQWAGNFRALVTIRNDASPTVNGWTLRWSFPNGQQIVTIWQTGQVTMTGAMVAVQNAPSNAVIAPGASVEFGFIGSWTGVNNRPTAFTLNGTGCARG